MTVCTGVWPQWITAAGPFLTMTVCVALACQVCQVAQMTAALHPAQSTVLPLVIGWKIHVLPEPESDQYTPNVTERQVVMLSGRPCGVPGAAYACQMARRGACRQRPALTGMVLGVVLQLSTQNSLCLESA